MERRVALAAQLVLVALVVVSDPVDCLSCAASAAATSNAVCKYEVSDAVVVLLLLLWCASVCDDD